MSEDHFPGSSADFYERIQVLKAEFQKAKEWNQLCELQIRNLQSVVEDQDKLITELADHIEAAPGDELYGFRLSALIKKAREAVK
jgi:hypothetical protein